jgi:uncharacterized protein (DUF1501 family)
MANDCGCGRHGDEGLSRRDLVKAGAGVAGVMALGPFRGLLPAASGAPQDLSRLVVINLFGGNDSLNMFIPVNLAPYYDRRPGLAIAPGDGLDLNTGPWGTTAYRLHPSMPRIQALWAEGSVAAIQRVGYPRANLSHFSSQDIFSLGVRDGFGGLGIPQSGWAARFADAHAPTPMGAVALGVGRMLDFEGGATSPFLANDLASFRLTVGASSPQVYRLAVAKSVIQDFAGTGNAGEARKALGMAHDLSDQVQAALAAHGTRPVAYSTQFISQRMRDVAVLVEGGFETRVFYTGFGGFDTHAAQGTTAGAQATLFGRLDDAVGSFAADMKTLGVWDRTAIYVLTEFGRRNYINGSDGTDHGHAFTALVVGGGVKGGVYGPDLVEADLLSEYPSYEVDFRKIYKELLANHLASDPAPVFPEALEKNADLGFMA